MYKQKHKNKIVVNNTKAETKFEKKYKANTEIIEVETPKIKACFLVNLPVGIGLKHVLDIKESRSDSYHIFSAPAAPDPKATAKIENIASK